MSSIQLLSGVPDTKKHNARNLTCKTIDTLASIIVSDREPLWDGHTRAGNALGMLFMSMSGAAQVNPAMWSARLLQIAERLGRGPLLPALVAGYRQAGAETADVICREVSAALLSHLIYAPANVTLLLCPAAEGGFELAPDLAATLSEPMEHRNEICVFQTVALIHNMLSGPTPGPRPDAAAAQLIKPEHRMISSLLRLVAFSAPAESGPDLAFERVWNALCLLKKLLIEMPTGADGRQVSRSTWTPESGRTLSDSEDWLPRAELAKSMRSLAVLCAGNTRGLKLASKTSLKSQSRDVLIALLESPFLASCEICNPVSPKCIWAETGADLALASAFREEAARAVARGPRSRRGVGEASRDAEHSELYLATALQHLLVLHPAVWPRLGDGPDGRLLLDAVSALAGPPTSWSPPTSEEGYHDQIRVACAGIIFILTSLPAVGPPTLDVRACGMLPASAENAMQFFVFAARRCAEISGLRSRCLCQALGCGNIKIKLDFTGAIAR